MFLSAGLRISPGAVEIASAPAADFGYAFLMIEAHRLTDDEVKVSRTRRLEAMALQAVEGNPLSHEQIAMFEMFERERWPHARRRAHILAKAIPLAAE